MPSTLKTPGVYIEEINLLPASVAQVATAVPAFVGYTETIPPLVDGNIPPTRITSMLEYEQIFGGPDKRILLTVTGALATPTPAPVVSLVDPLGSVHILYYCVKMYFDNGGGPCYIASAGVYPDIDDTQISITDLQPALELLEFEDEPTLLVVPEIIYTSTLPNWGTMATAILAQCAKLQDRFAILDTHTKDSYTHATEISNFRTTVGTQNLKYGACYYPRLVTQQSYQFEGTDPDAVTIYDDDADAYFSITDFLVEYPTFTTFVNTTIPAEIAAEGFDQRTMTLPPSAAIAGVYASTDRTRGVWKAPANVSLNGVISPTMLLTNAEQEDLNIPNDGMGKSVNAIRSFTGKGIMVWGARTLAGNDNEWRYVPVRRLFITMEESIKKATQFVVFEPNDANTWVRVRNMIETYLGILWKQGAFAGAKPEDAYFVNIGLGETMTAQDILEGRLIVEIGVAAVRPAEFIVLRFMHKLQES